MTDLPAPLTPPDCDLRGTPVPLDMLVRIAVETFGLDAAAAENMVRRITDAAGISVSDVGHA